MTQQIPTSPAPALPEALALIQKGDLRAADDMLTAMLVQTPEDPDALQLKGIVCRRSGRLSEAIDHFRRSLRANDAQPHVHNNLGAALAASGQKTDAAESYRRALALQPNYADAAYNLGLLLLDEQSWREARQALEAALRSDPLHARAAEALSIALRQLEDKDAAVTVAKRAVALSPSSYTAHHNLGKALLDWGDHVEAQKEYVAAIRLKPDSDVSWIGLGHAYRYLGSNTDALKAYRQAAKINPSNADAHLLLNEMLWQSGDRSAYLSSFPEAITARPGDARLRLSYANELLRCGQYAPAGEELLIAAVQAPHDGHIADAVARFSALTGDYDRAVQDHRRALDAVSDDPLLYRNFLETLLKAERYAAALDLSVEGRRRFPNEQGVLALQTTALRLLGEVARHDAIADYSALPTIVDLAPPPGFRDIGSFNAELAKELLRLHTSVAHPTDQTVRGGTQTFGSLFSRPEPLINLLRVQIEKAVADYVRGMPDDPAHPLYGRKSSHFRFSGSWSIRLTAEGFHTNHFHPKGWISSAYYVDLPEAVGEEDTRDGWLKMGETNLELKQREVIQRAVRPQVGRLALFPSYFWHGTVPFQGAGTRLTVAFDVIPA